MDSKPVWLRDSLDNEDREQFLPGKIQPQRKRSFLLSWPFAINSLMLAFSVGLAVYSQISMNNLLQNKNNALIRQVDFFSPAHDQMSLNFVQKKVNGSLLDMHGSIYRQAPSPEVDEAWERISSLLPHVISTDDVIALGKDPSKTARWPEDWGFGPEAHIGELDILHTIHCLNAIRRDVHWEYYFADRYPDGRFPELHKVHTDHCLYIVLQNLMCSATMDIITQPWVDGQLHPFPDFNVNKQCRDFDSILDWHERTMVTDMERFVALRAPEGHIPYRMSDEFHRMFETNYTFGHDHHHQ